MYNTKNVKHRVMAFMLALLILLSGMPVETFAQVVSEIGVYITSETDSVAMSEAPTDEVIVEEPKEDTESGIEETMIEEPVFSDVVEIVEPETLGPVESTLDTLKDTATIEWE